MREDSVDESKFGGGDWNDLVRENILQMGSNNPEPPQQGGGGFTLPAPGTPIFGDGGVFNQDQGTVNPPYYNPPAAFPGNDVTGGNPPPVQQQQQPPPPATNTVQSPSSYTPPSSGGGQSYAPPPQSAASSIPQDLLGILNSLKEGLANFSIPPINIQPQTTPAYDELVRNAIMEAIRSGQQPVDATDPMIAPLLAAVQGQGQRAKESNQGRLAEQLSAKHLLSSGAYDTGVERYNQGIDEATGGTLAQLMTNVLSQRQQKLMQAIQMGANYLNADQARQLQAELSNVNSALAQYQAKSSVGLGTLASLLQNQQFYDQLGSNIGMFTANQNSNASNFF